MSDSELTLANPRLQMSEEGHPFLMSDAPTDGRPSLEASTPGKAKGIGGTVVGSERPMGGSQPSPAPLMASGQSRPHAVSMSPAQMLIAADEMEQGFLNQQRQMDLDGPSVRRLGGGSAENGYNTELTQGAEKAFGRWSVPGDDPGTDYDYRGAFAVGGGRDGSGHMTDQFKKPNHPTFSDESQYADQGYPGSWKGEQFQPSMAQTGVPEWLHEYMDKQPFTDPYHQVMPGRVDLLNSNKYLQERDRLKYLKNLREQGKF